ncbi:hypothetical protein SAY86_031396 [Trapa natans]|uniref:Uncharacterized protein n=1 Tax=Trapa natans TaxID=22666 RepID=A0AAN7R9N8_TRANT|nr:hypothetical protein SAY86_031396 [Trapa natans]
MRSLNSSLSGKDSSRVGRGGGEDQMCYRASPFLISFTLLISLPLLFLLLPRILPPLFPLPDTISPADELDDLSVLRRASAASSSLSRLSSSSSSLKIAFLFLTNSDLHFSPLWQRFFRDGRSRSLFNIYVHADPSANISLPPAGSVFHGRLIPSKRTSRASPTLISATRRLLAAAILDDPANFYFAVLSQYCIPLHSFDYVYRSLVISTTFDSSIAIAESAQHGVRLRYNSYIEVLDRSSRLWKRYIARGRYVMLPEVPFDKFRVGSQFFTLTRLHALMVVRDRSLWRKFKLPCYREDACFPEEHYFPTLLSMKDRHGLTGYTLTAVNWTGTVNGHPHTYGPREVSPELIQRLRDSKHSESYLFARKFSPDCLAKLMEIADSAIFQE